MTEKEIMVEKLIRLIRQLDEYAHRGPANEKQRLWEEIRQLIRELKDPE